MEPQDTAEGRSRAGEIFVAFLRLGLTSFGGPIAHLGYFREAFVQRRRWLDDAAYAQLLSLCQFLPGPASSQMGFAIGLMRGGWSGAFAAFVGFTLPSAVLMFAAAVAAPHVLQARSGQAVVHGLKLVAVAVVAHGLYGMARTLTPDLRRVVIALLGCALIVWSASATGQLLVIALGAMLGGVLCRDAPRATAPSFPRRLGRGVVVACTAVFAVGLALALQGRGETATLAGLAASFYRAGALVFGGGHVVLPLLRADLVGNGWLSPDTFLAGYGAAQAMPGPMFTLAAFLGGSVNVGVPPALAALVSLLAIFAPGFLLLAATLPAWQTLSSRSAAVGAVVGINAAVVGLLAAALYDPVWREGVRGPGDVMIAAIGLALLFARARVLWVVAWCVAAACVETLVLQ